MLQNNRIIRNRNAEEVYAKYAVSKKDLNYYYDLIDQGREEEALDLFVDNHLIKAIQDYNLIMEDFLTHAEQGELPVENRRKMEKMVTSLTYGLSLLLIKNYNILADKIFAPIIFKERGISTPKVKEIIVASTTKQFDAYVSKAFTGVQVDILSNIRNIQKEMILFNMGKAKALKGEALRIETQNFLSALAKRFPGYYKMKDGKLLILTSVTSGDMEKYHQLQNYIEQTARGILLNIDRLSTQISVINRESERALKKGRVAVNVVSYYKRSNRIIKTKERVICQEILSQRKYGEPILALDADTAKILGIMTLDEATSTPDFALSYNCRHSIKPVTVATRKLLEKILKDHQRGIS